MPAAPEYARRLLAPAAFGDIAASSGFEGLIDDVISIIGQHQHLRGHARGGGERRASAAAAAIDEPYRRVHACALAQGVNTLSRQQ